MLVDWNIPSDLYLLYIHEFTLQLKGRQVSHLLSFWTVFFLSTCEGQNLNNDDYPNA